MSQISEQRTAHDTPLPSGFRPFDFSQAHSSKNINVQHAEGMTLGARIADAVAAAVGSWPFIIIQSLIRAAWILLNVIGIFGRWDAYPFILLNLALSFQAAYAAPFVMMSQNRQAAKDRLTAENDYQCDLDSQKKAEHIIENLAYQDAQILTIVQRLEQENRHLDAQDQNILEILKRLEMQQQELRALVQSVAQSSKTGDAEHR